MYKIFTFFSIILFLSCNQSDSNKNDTKTENSYPQNDTFEKNHLQEKFKTTIDTTLKRKTDTTLLLNVSAEILTAIKKRDYKKFAVFIHPKYGVRFSPYANIDRSKNQVLSKSWFIQLASQNKHINWHSSLDPETDSESLTIDQYFKQFVYDVDFLNAPVKSLNEFHSQGTDLNNITEAYPNCDVVEFYFPGFDKKFDGMDFRGLRLVFKPYNKRTYLIAIVHDQWTP